jgi:ATP-dependent exoDNAse (exonuclease V) beta subunit
MLAVLSRARHLPDPRRAGGQVKRPLTRAQRAVLETPGHLLVDAGAGSGKTTTVVQALCHQLGVPVLAEGGLVAHVPEPLGLDQVAAITFTNQSAADLKRKLRAALRAGGRPDLASDVDAARIGTIHGFCGDLLRDFALRARTRPGRTVLTEGEAALLRADSVRGVLHAALEEGNVVGLADLLAGRKLKQITEWLVSASEDSDRLARWAADAGTLRPHEQALLTLAQRVAEANARELDARGDLDFDRMIVATRELLLDDAVRYAVQRRIRLLVVDEFQDVDPVQRDIAERIGGLADARDPQPARLILVGDPKQSIYRFRRADVTVWNGMATRFASGEGTVVPLVENFRSKAAILGFVDAVIGTQLDDPVDAAAGRQPFEVDYEPLTARADRHEGDQAVELLVVPAGDKDKARKAEEVRDAEAAGIAARLTHLRRDGREWRDMAVLLASWSDVDRYAEALRRAGAPVYVRRGEGFWTAREVLDAVLALRVLRDPADDLAMVGFLRSPFVGVRDDTLLAIARARGAGAYASALDAVPNERELLAQARALLARFAPLRDRLPAHELLQRLLDESGYLVAAALDRDGDQRVANLRKLVRLAAAAPDLSLGEFLREIDLSRAREEKVAPERLHAEGGDVVTITSIHGAKGLEWPIVVWADLVRQRVAPNEAFLAGRERFAIKSADSGPEETDGKDPVHEAVKAQEILEGEAESRRLWYVAATRAKDLLILGGIPLGELKADSPAQRLRGALPDLSTARELAYVSRAGEPFHARVITLAVDGASDASARAVDESATDESAFSLPPAPIAVAAGATRLSATQLMTFARDPAQWHRTYVARFDPALVGADGRTTGRAIVAGRIVHDVLERIGDDESELETLLEQAIARWDEDAPESGTDLGRQYRAFLGIRIEAAQQSPAWRALATAPSARRELEFMRVRRDGTAIIGAFDLVARDGDAVRILDLKNSAASPEALAERYRVQAAVYTEAARAITGARECDFVLLALPSSTTVTVTPAEDLDGLIARLRAPDAPSAPRPRSARP